LPDYTFRQLTSDDPPIAKCEVLITYADFPRWLSPEDPVTISKLTSADNAVHLVLVDPQNKPAGVDVECAIHDVLATAPKCEHATCSHPLIVRYFDLLTMLKPTFDVTEKHPQ
jgi:hypothetical protein